MATETRWISVNTTGILEYSQTADRLASYAAQEFAEAVVDSADSYTVEQTRAYYLSKRAEARRVSELCDRLYAHDACRRFAGYLVHE